MNFKELLAYGAEYLDERGIADPRSESEVLTREAASVSRAWLYSHLDANVSQAVFKIAEGFLRRRGNHEPTPYITGHKEFFGLDFQVDKRVLIPRPETELLVEKGIAVCRRLLSGQPAVVVADIGTGSGAVAVSVAVYVPQAAVIAVDVSADALEVAKLNCLKHGVEERVRLLQGDLLEPVSAPVDIILANLPYVKDVDMSTLQFEIRGFEPVTALRGGKAGLSLIRRLLKQARSKISPTGTIAVEIAWDQGRSVATIAKSTFPRARLEVRKDLAGLDRVIEIDLSLAENERKSR